MIPSRAYISLEDGWASVPGPRSVFFTDGAAFGPHKPETRKEWNANQVRPTGDQWAEFLRMCDAIDIWSLEEQVTAIQRSCYIDSADFTSGEVRFSEDGLNFRLDLRVGDRAVTVCGPIQDVPPGGEEKLWFIYCELLVMAGWELPEKLVSRRYVPANLTPQKSE